MNMMLEPDRPIAFYLSDPPFEALFIVSAHPDGSITCDCPGFRLKGTCIHSEDVLARMLDKTFPVVSADPSVLELSRFDYVKFLINHFPIGVSNGKR